MKSLDELLLFTLATLNAVGDMISKQEAGDAIERAFQDSDTYGILLLGDSQQGAGNRRDDKRFYHEYRELLWPLPLPLKLLDSAGQMLYHLGSLQR